MKSVYYISLFILIFSCSKNQTYTRYTDLHHTKPIKLFSIDETKDSISCNVSFTKSDSLITKAYSFALNDTNFRYVEHKKVVQFYGSYYIRDNVKSKRIFKTYYNRDVKF